jgi:flagellar hook-length control protein FliK
MISTPATRALETLLPRQGGQAPHAADAAAAPNFAELINRLIASTFSVAALTPAPEIHAAPPAQPDRERIEPEPRDERADRPEQKTSEAAPRTPDETVPAADARDDRLPPETPAPATAQPAEANAAPALRLPLQAPSQQSGAVAAPAASPAPQGAERPTVQGPPQPLLQANEPDVLPPQQKQPAPQHAAAGAGLRAQAVPGEGTNQLPQFGHTLSGRTAVVAQVEPAAAVLPKDGGPAAKAGSAEQAAAALLGNAPQASPLAAQRAKGLAKPGNAGGNSQNAQGTQATQPAGQVVPQAAAAGTPPQNGFNNALAASANGTGQAATAPQGARSEPFAPVGVGQSAPHTNFRGVDPAVAPKPRTPVPPRFVANQVAVQIQKSIGQGNDRISIQLRPAELGKVDVRLDVGSDGRVTAVITADRADTLDLLQRDARILQNSLQDAGLRADSNSLSFELKGNGQSFAEAHEGRSGKDGTDPAGADGLIAADAAATAARPGIVTNDRVDIHV